METKKIKDSFDKKLYQFYLDELNNQLTKWNTFFFNLGYEKELLVIINRTLKLFISQLNDKYVAGIIELLNLDEGKRYNGIFLKKYFGSHNLLFSFFLNFPISYLLPEISIYRKYYKSKIRPKDFFNEVKIKRLVESYFSIVPVFESIIKYKIGIEHKRSSSSSEYKQKELFPALKRITDSFDKCELRRAIVLLESNQPGIIDSAGEILKIDYKKLCKIEYEIEQKNIKFGRKRCKQFSDDEIIEFQSRVLSKEIKSSYSSFLKNFNKEQ